MGHLCYIVNHTKGIKLHPTMKFRELLLNHWGDILLLLMRDSWNMDKVDVICDSDMAMYELFMKYKDKTEEIFELYKDSIGDKA